MGRLDEAMANHQEAHTLAGEIGDRSVQAYALNYIGTTHLRAGHLDDAMHYQRQAAAARTVTDPNLHTQLQLDHGLTCQARGDHPGALAAYQAALDLATDTGDRGQQAHAHHGIAQVLHALGEHERAAETWRTAETEFRRLHQPEADEIRRERKQLSCACAID